MTKYFVWVESHAGLVPQVWAEMQRTGEGKPKPYLACHAIADDDKRSLEELVKDFKYDQSAKQ